MPTKLTLILEQDKSQPRNAQAMQQCIRMLEQLNDTPPQKLAITLACEDEDALTVKEELQAVFARRPAGIKVTIKTASEEEIAVEKLVPLTPMEEALGEPLDTIGRFAAKHGARTEFVVSSDREPR